MNRTPFCLVSSLILYYDEELTRKRLEEFTNDFDARLD